MSTILLVDDQDAERRLLYHTLKGEHRVVEAADGPGALARLAEERPDLVLLDLHLPPRADTVETGVQVLKAIRESPSPCPVVITTGDQDRALALDMVRRGVADFLLKPIDPDVLRIVVARALERATLERDLLELRQRAGPRNSFGGLIAVSPAMREVFARLEKLARAPTTVLLLGESGTGKSAVARALHVESPRAGRPLVVVDGATIPEPLIESELFGHARGAFTGADSAAAGRLEMADGGTLFLDEVGNLSLAVQGKLLLFLDDHTITPVGSVQRRRVDVRLVVATHQDLDRLVRDGRFRADLFYRIQGATVVLPALRERREDVAPLAEHLLSILGQRFGRPGARLTPAAVTRLEAQSWPGNVRQLQHALESSLALADSDLLDARDLALPDPSSTGGPRAAGEGARSATERSAAAAEVPAGPAGDVPPGPGSPPASFKLRVAGFEREVVAEALERCHGNKAAAGRLLGLDENQIRYLCRKHLLG